MRDNSYFTILLQFIQQPSPSVRPPGGDGEATVPPAGVEIMFKISDRMITNEAEELSQKATVQAKWCV